MECRERMRYKQRDKEREREGVMKKGESYAHLENESFRRVSTNFNYCLQSKLKYLMKCNVRSKVLEDLFVHWHQHFIALKLISFIFLKTFKYFPRVIRVSIFVLCQTRFSQT